MMMAWMTTTTMATVQILTAFENDRDDNNDSIPGIDGIMEAIIDGVEGGVNDILFLIHSFDIIAQLKAMNLCK